MGLSTKRPPSGTGLSHGPMSFDLPGAQHCRRVPNPSVQSRGRQRRSRRSSARMETRYFASCATVYKQHPPHNPAVQSLNAPTSRISTISGLSHLLDPRDCTVAQHTLWKRSDDSNFPSTNIGQRLRSFLEPYRKKGWAFRGGRSMGLIFR